MVGEGVKASCVELSVRAHIDSQTWIHIHKVHLKTCAEEDEGNGRCVGGMRALRRE